MPRIADYLIITQSNFSIQSDGDIDREFNFTLESGASLASRAVLVFDISIQPAANNLRFEARINGSSQESRSYTGLQRHSIHTVVDASLLRIGNNANNINFRILSGTGRLSIGDVVLFYQRDI